MNKIKYYLWMLSVLILLNLEADTAGQSLKYFKKEEPQLFPYWDVLTSEQRSSLFNQLNNIDFATLERQRQLIHESAGSKSTSFESFDEFACYGNQENIFFGQDLIKSGQVGCLLLAGGQGTRLGYGGPKGTYPISVIRQKSLFQLCSEKVRAASYWANRPLRLAVMTSPENDEETRLFFQQHHFFGLLPSQISFFIQESLPLLDAQGRLFLQTPSQLAMGADGNGNSLISLAKSGILTEWIQEGIRYINVILVDNSLADPFDAELVGFHCQQNAEITLKCTEKSQPDEKVGLLVKQEGKCGVVEYSEMTNEEKHQRRIDGKLKHCCANLSLFCFSVEFIQQMASENKTIPLHKAWKAASYVDLEGRTRLSTESIAWKFETFIFDWLAYTEKVAALLYPRDVCFAPLKNSKGPDSPETVRQAIQKREREILRNMGLIPPEFPFELASEFYYPTPSLLSKWRGRPITEPYLEP